MKRAFSIIIAAVILLCLPVQARELTLYSDDGREITVASEEEELWKQVGWKDRDQVYTTVYSQDGRQAEALNIDLALWEERGWSGDLADVQTTLYSWDGTSVAVWNAQVPEYLANLWVRTPEEVQTTLYSEDGRTLTVWNAQVEAQLTVGWYRTPEEVHTTVYNSDGESLSVWKAEAAAYLAQGWTLEPPAPAPKAVDPNKPMIALTFDDGPGPYTDKILDCLEKYGAKATFFVVGNRLSGYSAQLKREAELGMEIGGHSWAHKDLTTLGASGAAADVKKVSDKVCELTGVRPAVIRPPYGSHNATVRGSVGVPLILWDIDTLDWKTRNAASTYNAVVGKVKDGDIVLMHDIHSPTADAVERIVPALIDRGFQLVTVSEMAAARGGLTAGKAYSAIRP